jgi:hypothetical protein
MNYLEQLIGSEKYQSYILNTSLSNCDQRDRLQELADILNDEIQRLDKKIYEEEQGVNYFLERVVLPGLYLKTDNPDERLDKVYTLIELLEIEKKKQWAHLNELPLNPLNPVLVQETPIDGQELIKVSPK